MLTRRCLLAGTLATFAAPLVVTAQPPTKPAAVRGLIYRGKDAIGNGC